ncbi:hypothetical protein [Micromonospora sp. MH33]|uniref:hypothetical protein n=1 Tax=Micromonospora sp. MH33 TaxID=1945509 RepID=UPI00143D1F2A|nr:hypothetical protein [Micromonospora sp. MH33]
MRRGSLPCRDQDACRPTSAGVADLLGQTLLLLRVYANFVDGGDDTMNDMIGRALG